MLLIRLFVRVQYKSRGRLYLIFMTGLTGYGSLGPAPTMTAMFAAEHGPRALLSIGLIVLAALAFADLVINEFLTERFVWRTSLHWREMIYAAIAVCYTVAAIQADIYGHPVFLAFFIGSTVAALTAGFSHVFQIAARNNEQN